MNAVSLMGRGLSVATARSSMMEEFEQIWMFERDRESRRRTVESFIYATRSCLTHQR